MEIIPLLRIVRSTNEESGIPRQDPEFTPPCFVVNASPVLREMVRDIAAQLEASRKELTVQLTRGGTFDLNTLRGVQFEQVWRMRTLNNSPRACPRSPPRPRSRHLTWYLELRELLADLVALYPAANDFDVVALRPRQSPALLPRSLRQNPQVSPRLGRTELLENGFQARWPMARRALRGQALHRPDRILPRRAHEAGRARPRDARGKSRRIQTDAQEHDRARLFRPAAEGRAAPAPRASRLPRISIIFA